MTLFCDDSSEYYNFNDVVKIILPNIKCGDIGLDYRLNVCWIRDDQVKSLVQFLARILSDIFLIKNWVS